jgi:hypothetical protein
VRAEEERQGCVVDGGTAAGVESSSGSDRRAARTAARVGVLRTQGRVTRESVTGPNRPEGSNGESALYGSNVA